MTVYEFLLLPSEDLESCTLLDKIPYVPSWITVTLYLKLRSVQINSFLKTINRNELLYSSVEKYIFQELIKVFKVISYIISTVYHFVKNDFF